MRLTLAVTVAMMAMVVLATLPVLILYLFFQRYFVEGIAASGVKG